MNDAFFDTKGKASKSEIHKLKHLWNSTSKEENNNHPKITHNKLDQINIQDKMKSQVEIWKLRFWTDATIKCMEHHLRKEYIETIHNSHYYPYVKNFHNISIEMYRIPYNLEDAFQSAVNYVEVVYKHIIEYDPI